MREQSSAGLYNEENSIDNQNDDENFSVLTAQGVNFFRFLFATSIHDLNLNSSTVTVPSWQRAHYLGQYMMIATPTKLTAPPIKSTDRVCYHPKPNPKEETK